MNEINTKTILLGLGNNGAKFMFTPHNIGHQIIDNIIDSELLDSQNLIIIKNKEYMNNAGNILNKYLPAQDRTRLIVISDDIDLPLGLMRIRHGHSSNGHNGLKSINNIWSTDYWLIKIGFCPSIDLDQDNYHLRHHNSAQYVLKQLKGDNKIKYQKMALRAFKEISTMIKEDTLRNQTIDLLGEDKCL